MLNVCEYLSFKTLAFSILQCILILLVKQHNHSQARDNTMKAAALEVEQLARPSVSLFAGAQASKVLCSSWNDVGTKLHLDPTLGRTSDGDIKEYDRIFGAHFDNAFTSW